MNERGEQPGFVPSNEGGDVSRGPLEQSLPPEMKIEGVEATIIPEPQVPSSESTPTPEVGADVIANLEQKLAAQRVAQAESHQRMEARTGPVGSNEVSPMDSATDVAEASDHTVTDSMDAITQHEQGPATSIEVNPETGPFAEARKLDDARERYASTMRSQKKWLGAASPEKVEEARKEYIEQAATALKNAVGDIKKKYEGQDLQNPELQAAFQADLLSATMEHRMSEEQALRETMRDGQHRRLLDGFRTFWKKHSKARMVASGTLTGISIATMGTPLSSGANALRALISGTSTGVTVEAAGQLIRKDFGDTRELKPEYIQQLRDRISSADSKDQVAAKSELERLIAAHTMQQVEDGAKEFGVQDRGILKWRHKDETGKQLLDMYDESIRSQQEQEIAFHVKSGKSVEEIVALHVGAVGGEREVLHDAYIKRIKSNKKWNAAIGATSIIAGTIVGALGVTHAVKAAQHATGMMHSAHDAKDHAAEAAQKAMATSAGGHPPVPPSSLPFGTATPDAMGLHAAPIDTAHVSTQHVVEQASGHPFGDASPDAIGLHTAPLETTHQSIADASDHPFGNGTPDTIGRYSTHLAPETTPSDALHVNPTEVPKAGSESLHFLGDTAHQATPTATAEIHNPFTAEHADLPKPTPDANFHNPFTPDTSKDFHNPFAPDTSKDFHNPFSGQDASLAGKPEPIADFHNPFTPDSANEFHNPFTPEGRAAIEHAKTVAAAAGNAVEHVEVAQSGDSVWSLTEKFVDHQFPNLSAEQRTWMIDSIKDKIVAHPELADLKNADHLEIGAKVNFDKLGIDFSSVAEKATHLSPEITKGIHEHLASHVDTAASVVAGMLIPTKQSW
jgi:uncharacterized protein YnzC (UPF0291/DUF896 family)